MDPNVDGDVVRVSFVRHGYGTREADHLELLPVVVH